jgi:hypothetical protein
VQELLEGFHLTQTIEQLDVVDRQHGRPEAARPMVTDPALSRAIDLLKALAVVRQTRS